MNTLLIREFGFREREKVWKMTIPKLWFSVQIMPVLSVKAAPRDALHKPCLQQVIELLFFIYSITDKMKKTKRHPEELEKASNLLN